ncbi:hypothetical protein TNCV_4077471 [Trichonephila clavipes]|uniref:Uncharacterized protein n=1 Tax=Trichonephila clavipes TaxID=2585209 RepID=A0A8X6R423_TRICX|nr:hypothetical protein TNCV_4077471 [Trichonephila clavipes]
MVRKKKRSSNPRKNIALTAKEIESSSSPNKISESHTSKLETMNEIKIKQEKNVHKSCQRFDTVLTVVVSSQKFYREELIGRDFRIGGVMSDARHHKAQMVFLCVAELAWKDRRRGEK